MRYTIEEEKEVVEVVTTRFLFFYVNPAEKVRKRVSGGWEEIIFSIVKNIFFFICGAETGWSGGGSSTGGVVTRVR